MPENTTPGPMKRNEWLFVAAITLVAAMIRAPGLGKWGLSIDEYYFSQSVTFILDHGLPRFPDGGYYVRGIGLQYLTTIPMLLLDHRELAARLLPLVFGILSIPMFYLLSRKFLPPVFAAACSLLLLFSSWHIEFSRFARMYAPFQFFLFLFIYFLYAGYYENREKAKTGTWIVAFLSILFYEGSIFLPVFLFCVIVTREQGDSKEKMLQVGGVVLLVAVNYIAYGFPYHRIGVFDRLPAEAARYSYQSKGNSPIDLPDITLFFDLWKSPVHYVPYTVLFIIGGIILLTWIAKQETSKMNIFVLAILLLFALFHQFGLVILTSSIYIILRKNFISWHSSAYRGAGYFFLAFLIFWIGIGYRTGHLEKIKGYLVGYPAFKYKIYMPFADAVPIWGLILAIALVCSLARNMLSRNSRIIAPISAIVVLSFTLVAVLHTPVYIHTTRYCFSFFPLMFIVGMFELESFKLPGTISQSHPNWKYALLAIPVSFMVVTEDYHIRHILDASSKETNFRMGKYSRYAGHWYRRADTRTPTVFVDNIYKKGDVVVLDNPPMSLYLSKPFINYINISDVRIPYESRKGGTSEMWTGKPLIYKEEQLAEAIPESPDNALWLVAVRQDYIDTSFSVKNPPENLSGRFDVDVNLRRLGVDGRIGAWEIRRRERKG
jgi:4-amino-4-deoxy-L-arabinose transferase-like glycosyltransferase